MKILAILLFAVSAFAQTWTLHFCPDNCTSAAVYGPTVTVQVDGGNTSGYSWMGFAALDSGWDSANPSQAYSGWELDVFDTSLPAYVVVSSQRSYSGTYTFDSLGETISTWCSISGPYPDYNNYQESELGTLFGGEFWIDFTLGAAIRVSTTQPIDFGKWAWDGSINPSWVAPLAKRGKAKGHK